MPASASAWSSSFPAGPTNGRPALSSWSPGCSPTNIASAPALPSPKTTCVPVFQRSQALQPAASLRSLARLAMSAEYPLERESVAAASVCDDAREREREPESEPRPCVQVAAALLQPRDEQAEPAGSCQQPDRRAPCGLGVRHPEREQSERQHQDRSERDSGERQPEADERPD